MHPSLYRELIVLMTWVQGSGNGWAGNKELRNVNFTENPVLCRVGNSSGDRDVGGVEWRRVLKMENC